MTQYVYVALYVHTGHIRPVLLTNKRCPYDHHILFRDKGNCGE